MTDGSGAETLKEETPKQWEKADHKGNVLDPRQFPELNAVFYSADPSEFIKMRIEALSLLACHEAFLAPAFAVGRRIGSIEFGGGSVPPTDARQRYIRTEAVAIVHHASEALLRLYFAHLDHPECPWLGMSASTNFVEFKEQVAAALKAGFDREDIARLFLGGLNPDEAGIDLPADDFAKSVEAIEYLLVDCSNRFLGDSFLYNAVKHGLTAIDLDDDEAKMEWTTHDGKRVPMHTGPVHVYLHKKLNPTAKPTDGQWFLSLDDPNPERDLAITSLVTYAIDSLWDVARRRYMGTPGSIVVFGKGAVELATYGTITQAKNLMKRMVHELIKVKPDGEVDGTNHLLSIYNVPDDWNPDSGFHTVSMTRIELPLREGDEVEYSTSTRAYLPITPKGFQQA